MKKTYLVGILLAILGALRSMGVIDDQLYQAIFSLLVGAGAITVRQAISKNGEGK